LKWRPKVRPSSDPAGWWRYAGTIIRKGIRKKREERSWRHILESLRTRREYVALFKRTQQIADWLPPLNAAEKSKLESLEEHLPFEKIVFFRNIARAELNKELPIAKEKKAALLKQKKGWFGFVSSFVNDAPKFDIQLTPAEMDEIYSIIDYNEISADTQKPKDFVRFEMNFLVKAVSLSVFGASSQTPLLHGILSDISFHFQQRVQGFKALADLGKFTVTDFFTPQSQFPEVIRTVLGSSWKKGNEGVAGAEKLFSLALEGQPLSGASDYSLRVTSHPLEVVANVPLLDRLRLFFTPEERLSFVGFSSVADKFNSIKEMTQLQLMDALHQHKTIDLAMDIKAPVLIVPENPSRSDTLLAFFDLGNFTIQSDLSQTTKGEHTTFRQEDLYDRYKVSLTCIKALLAQNDLNWRDTNLQHKMSMHLVKEFDINLFVQKCIEPKGLSLTQLKVSGSLPKLEANLSDKKLISTVRMLDALFPSQPPALVLPTKSDSDAPEIEEILSEPSPTQIEKDIKELEDQLEQSTVEPQYSEVQKKRADQICPIRG
jgi:vacuolar protein sorting-associated protein 13A/C